MSLNTTLNLGSGGDIIATVDLNNFGSFGYPVAATGVKLPCSCLYVSQAIGTIPTPVTTANPIPTAQQGALPAGTNVIGHVIVDSGAITASGTVSLGAGVAAIGTVTTNADANVAAGTAPSKTLLWGTYNTTPPAATNGQSVGLQTNSAGGLLVDGSGGENTFSASGTFTPAASATDIAILPGSASKTIKVLRVKVQLQSTSAQAQNLAVQLIKRSTANSGGTSATLTVVPHDSNDAGGSAVPLTYSVNPTTGTSIGAVDTGIISTQGVPTSGNTSNPNNEWVVDYTAAGMQPVTLRGVAQGLAVNLGGATLTSTATAKVTFTYKEV